MIPNIVEGGAIASIASAAGIGWLHEHGAAGSLLATPDFAAAKAWCEADPKRASRNGYGLSKEAINAYTAVRSFTLAPQGIRINCLNPGPTDTPMMPQFEQAVGKKYMTKFPKPLWGRNAAPTSRRGRCCSSTARAASYVTGTQFDADAGFKGGLFTGQIDPVDPHAREHEVTTRVTGSASRNWRRAGAATRPPTPPPSTMTANATLPR